MCECMCVSHHYQNPDANLFYFMKSVASVSVKYPLCILDNISKIFFHLSTRPIKCITLVISFNTRITQMSYLIHCHLHIKPLLLNLNTTSATITNHYCFYSHPLKYNHNPSLRPPQSTLSNNVTQPHIQIHFYWKMDHCGILDNSSHRILLTFK